MPTEEIVYVWEKCKINPILNDFLIYIILCWEDYIPVLIIPFLIILNGFKLTQTKRVPLYEIQFRGRNIIYIFCPGNGKEIWDFQTSFRIQKNI